MLIVHSSLPQIPPYARVPDEVMNRVARRFSPDDANTLSEELTAALDSCRRHQPELARHLERLMTRAMNEDARAFGVSAALTVWTAFHDFAIDRMSVVGPDDWQASEALFEADRDMRKSDPDMLSDSDEVLSALQPALLAYLRKNLESTIEEAAASIDLEDLERAYHFVLVEILALSRAIGPGRGSSPFLPS